MWSNVGAMRTAKVDGLKLKSAREAAGHTQTSLAKKVGVDRSTLAHWESDDATRQPGPATYRALINALGVERSDLLVSEEAAA